MTKITRPTLRYYGGKFKIAPWILRHFPDHRVYVEPYAGAASVLLRKPPAAFEVLNDIDSNVVNFFRVLRERPEDLRRLIELTPFSREETYASCAPSEDPLERARRFYIRAWQTMHGAPHMGKNGWRLCYSDGKNGKRSAVDDWNDTARILACAQRLKLVQIEHDDALKVITRFDTDATLFFCDPPYLMSVRTDRWARNGYEHEMADEQHGALAELLSDIRGMAVVAGYPSPLYEQLYRGWRVVSHKQVNMRSKSAVECLWISPRAAERLSQREIDWTGGG